MLWETRGRFQQVILVSIIWQMYKSQNSLDFDLDDCDCERSFGSLAMQFCYFKKAEKPEFW